MINENIIKEVDKQMHSHNDQLSKYATNDSQAIYLKEQDSDFRTSFFRDIDKIIYSLAFIRYQDKTQVFSWSSHNHVSKRMIHVQFVSKIARTIARALGLNEDLIEAASLGHDLGHTPFGHVGESILNNLSIKYKEGYFNHNIQSVRNLMYVENYGKGLNISIQVLDAIMCHNGEIALGKYEPCQKTKEAFLEEYKNSYKDKNEILKMRPMTLEGCVVRVSDLIAYLGRDIDDAIRLKLLKRTDIPQSIVKVLGNSTSSIVNTCVQDIINNSYQKNYIQLSEEVYQAILELKKFNYEKIYNQSESSKEKEKLNMMFESLFVTYLEDIESKNMNSSIVNSYLKNMSEDYLKNNTPTRIVIDYIAGMTDDFFVHEYQKISS